MSVNLQNQKKLKRVIIYISETDYQKLRAKLILENKFKSASEWFRHTVREFIS